MKHSKIYASFDAELESITTYAKANQKRLAITDVILQDLEHDWQLWTANYQAYLDPDRQTTPVVLRAGTLHHDIGSYLSGFKRSLKYNPSLALSDQDYAKLYIHRNVHHRGHVPVPNVAPRVDLLETHHLTNRFEVTNPNPPDQNHRALPPGAAHVGRKLAVLAADSPAPQPSDYHRLTQVGRSIFELNFKPEQEGSVGYLIAWYVNRRGEAGPEGKPTMFRIT